MTPTTKGQALPVPVTVTKGVSVQNFPALTLSMSTQSTEVHGMAMHIVAAYST